MTAEAALELTTGDPAETMAMAAAFAALCRPGDVIGLKGTLGAGKTCFVKGLARGLGVRDERSVISPTFVLMRSYEGRLDLHHFDAYRLHDARAMEEIGCDEAFAGGGVSVVEWADHVITCLPARHFLLEIEVLGPAERRFRLSAGPDAGPPVRERLAELRRALARWAAG